MNLVTMEDGAMEDRTAGGDDGLGGLDNDNSWSEVCWSNIAPM